MKEQVALQNALRSRLETLRIRYPNYSVRAFAKKAGLSPATLSLVLQGRRKVSQKLAGRLSEKLHFDPMERAEVLGPQLDKKSKQAAHKKSSPAYIRLTQDQYRVISDWRAFAILNLIRTEGFESDPAYIAKRLGITAAEAKEAVAHLERLGMVKWQNGRLSRTAPRYQTTDDIANSALQKSHQQSLELAMRSLENDPVESRDFTWVTFPLDPGKLPEAKALIRKFQDDLLEILGKEARPTEVFRLAVQLFPLTKIVTKRESLK